MRQYAKITAASVFALGAVAAAPAMAADIEPAPEIYDWSGIYIGAHGGYGFGDVDYDTSLTGESINSDIDGFIGGGQLGWNWQVDSIVFGGEASITAADLDGDNDSDVAGVNLDGDVSWYALFGGKLGFAADRSLFYAKGGYAMGEIGTAGTNANIPDAFSNDEKHDGWFIGGGMEYAATDNVILGAEYNYIDLGGKKNHNGTTTVGIPYVNEDVEAQIHTVTARVSFKFNPGR
jgi:outer membrane immunogenic protein